MAEWDLYEANTAKWNPDYKYISAAVALEKLKASALTAEGVPLTHRNPSYDPDNCQCGYCITKKAEEASDRDYFAALMAAANPSGTAAIGLN